jgi:predicted nucleic-acid-binding protein
MKYICDTNFILRYLLADNKEMFAKVKEIFDKAKTGDINLILEQTVFTEVVFVLSSFYKVPREKIALILSELLTYKGIKCEKEILITALDCYIKHNIHIVDAILIAKSRTSATAILTFDEKLMQILNQALEI